MSLTPVPPQHCTSCQHPPHAHACDGAMRVEGDDTAVEPCECGVATLPYADHHTTEMRLGRIEGMLERLTSRVEYLIEHVLVASEGARKVPALERRVEVLEERAVAGANGGGG